MSTDALVLFGRTEIDRAQRPTNSPYVTYLAHYENASSRATMARALDDACAVLGQNAATFPWWLLRRTHVLLLRTELAKRYAHTTANRILIAVRGVLKECRRAKLMSADDYADATDIDPVKGYREPPGRAIEPREIEAMRALCDPNTAIGCRNLAILSVLSQCGLRRDETRRLDRWSFKNGMLRIVGKGNKERVVYVNTTLSGDLARWLAHRGDAPGALFWKATPRGAIVPDSRLSYSGMQHIVLELARRAGVEDISMHDFRRTLISELIDEGTDLATVAKIVGHSSTDTTAKYDRRGERRAREALERHGKP